MGEQTTMNYFYTLTILLFFSCTVCQDVSIKRILNADIMWNKRLTSNENNTRNIDLSGLSISNLGGIEELDLLDCLTLSLKKNRLTNIESLLTQCKSETLSSIDLQGNQIRTIKFEALKQVQHNFPKLELIKLEDNPLDQETIQVINILTKPSLYIIHNQPYIYSWSSSEDDEEDSDEN